MRIHHRRDMDTLMRPTRRTLDMGLDMGIHTWDTSKKV